MKPKFLYNNLLTAATLSASGTYTGYTVQNILDEKPFTYWMAAAAGSNWIKGQFGSAQLVNCIGIVGHNLHTVGATVYVEYSSDGTNWSTAASNVPADDLAFMISFAFETTYAYWRLRIENTSGIPMIAVLFMGAEIEFEWPADTPHAILDEGINAIEELSKGGNMLGASVNFNDHALDRSFSNFTRTWFDIYFLPFWNVCGKLKKNFFYADDITNAPAQIYFCRFKNDFRLQPNVVMSTYINTMTISVVAVR